MHVLPHFLVSPLHVFFFFLRFFFLVNPPLARPFPATRAMPAAESKRKAARRPETAAKVRNTWSNRDSSMAAILPDQA
jgi:hypothetical protein